MCSTRASKSSIFEVFNSSDSYVEIYNIAFLETPTISKDFILRHVIIFSTLKCKAIFANSICETLLEMASENLHLFNPCSIPQKIMKGMT